MSGLGGIQTAVTAIQQNSPRSPCFTTEKSSRDNGHVYKQLNSDLELAVGPEELPSVRKARAGDTGRLEVLLKWQGLPEFEATWEDKEMMEARLPFFHLRTR